MWEFQSNTGGTYLCRICFAALGTIFQPLLGWKWTDEPDYNDYCIHCDRQVGELLEKQ